MKTEYFDFNEHPHRRYNPLTGNWLLVSPHRAKRPWQGQVERSEQVLSASFDAECYLCAGNTRVSGQVNDSYTDTYVFNNDFSALLADDYVVTPKEDSLFQFEPATGISQVICYSPDHSKTLPQMSLLAIEQVVKTWAELTSTLGKKYQWVQLFENKGSVMGCSNPHPHGQVWAHHHLPSEVSHEDEQQRLYFERHETPLLVHYAQQELTLAERVVVNTDHWLAVVPYWASWPFETLLLPKNHVQQFSDLTKEQQADLAVAIKELTIRYDNLFQCSFPYSMGWHGAPFNQKNNQFWQLHAHFYPPLLRDASIRKFMVGYEMLGESQRDLTPEQAAKLLRAQPTTHYLESN